MNLKEKSQLVDFNKNLKFSLKRMEIVVEKTLIITKANRLFGTITDGDLRRCILNKKNLKTKIKDICNKKPKFFFKDKFKISIASKVFKSNKAINLIPIVDNNYYVTNIIYKKNSLKTKKILKKNPYDVVIMAGGKGSRLEPFNKILPKPLIPVKGKPIILRIIEKFIENRFNDLFLSVNYKSKILKSFFSEINLKKKINFVYEDKPLGTIGALTKINKKFIKPIVVTNCDVIFNFNYNEAIKNHIIQNNVLTIVTSNIKYKFEHGTCKIDKDKSLVSMIEKPTIKYLINTGFYIVSPEILKFIPKNKYFDITDLIKLLKDKNQKIGTFTISSKSWYDVGNWKDYKKTAINLNF